MDKLLVPLLLVPLSEPTVALLVSLQHNPEEPYDAVVQRELGNLINGSPVGGRTIRPKQPPGLNEIRKLQRRHNGHGYAVELLGQRVEAASARDGMTKALEGLQDLDHTFLEKLSAEKGRTRRIVARRPEALYPGRPDLARYSLKICGSWYVGTNYSLRDIRRILQIACNVAGIQYGRDLILIEPRMH